MAMIDGLCKLMTVNDGLLRQFMMANHGLLYQLMMLMMALVKIGNMIHDSSEPCHTHAFPTKKPMAFSAEPGEQLSRALDSKLFVQLCSIYIIH